MKSKYFAIRTLENKNYYALVTEEITADELQNVLVDIAKQILPITEDEYRAHIEG